MPTSTRFSLAQKKRHGCTLPHFLVDIVVQALLALSVAGLAIAENARSPTLEAVPRQTLLAEKVGPVPSADSLSSESDTQPQPFLHGTKEEPAAERTESESVEARLASLGFVKGYTWGWAGRRGDYLGQGAIDSMARLAETGVDHVCIAFAAKMATAESSSFLWGSDSSDMVSDAEVRRAIALARSHGLKVILKPAVNCADDTRRSWIKFFRPITPEERRKGLAGVNDPWGPVEKFREDETVDIEAWDRWWDHYRCFLLHYAEIAADEEVEVFCIGCEMTSTEDAQTEWRDVIRRLRGVYDGLLTYNCNHGRESSVPWWDALDFMSVSGYYPTPPPVDRSVKDAILETTPKTEILEAMRHVRENLAAVSRRVGKPILFIETGVTNVRGAARYPWSHVDQNPGSPIDDREQVNYYEAMLEAFWDEPWCMGYCWWDWPPRLYTVEAAPSTRSFCIYGRPAQQVLSSWYTKSRSTAVSH